MSAADEMQIIGKITTAFGVHGWVKIYSFTENPEDIFSYHPWYLKTIRGWETCQVQDWRSQSKGLVARLDNCKDRDKALELRQVEIAVKLEQFKELEVGDYYWKDLLGCRVSNLQQEDFGVLTKFMETGANDVMLVSIDDQAVGLKNSKGKPLKERLVPYILDQVVIKVELDKKQIIVDWPSDF